MTLKELKDYPYVINAIKRYEKELAELYIDSAGSMSPDVSGMPHGHGASMSKVVSGYERNEKDIEELKEKIRLYRIRLQRYDLFFESIQEEQTLQIFELRFKHSKHWEDIAVCVGGNNTENTVKKICYRYLEKYNKNNT